jgi:hypothetical protein
MNKKYLPIGSVVLLKGKSRKLMITGYKSKTDSSDTVYDYNGILFPEGLMENTYALFNNDDIEEVFYEGLKNEEYENHIDVISTLRSGEVISADNVASVQSRGSRRSAHRRPTKPLSISEMRAKYTREEISGGQTEKFDFSKLKKN